jgi:hypothetical protein
VVKREIVNVVSEGILQLVTDGHETDDDVSGGDGTGDGDPMEGIVQLEGKEIDVEEDDLGDQDVVADGERSSEDTLGGGLGVGEGVETAEDLAEDDG